MDATDERKAHPLSILLVEDDREIHELLVPFLRRRFRTLHTAWSGEEGAELFLRHRPDLVVTDLKMPGGNGLEMSRKIKEASPDLPIVAVSAYNDAHFLLEAIDIGIDKYLIKPFSIDKLSDVLESQARIVLQRREARRYRETLLSRDKLYEAQRIAAMASFDCHLSDPGSPVVATPQFFRIFGIDPSVELGELEAFLSRILHPEEREPMLAFRRKMLEERKVQWQYRTRILRADGQVREVLFYCRPEYGPEGDVLRVHGVVQDVTEQHRLRQRLEESEDQFRAVFDQATEGILAADPETGRFLFSNRRMQEMLGYGEEELLELDPTRIYPEKDLPWVLAIFREQVGGKRKEAFGLPMLRKDGTVFFADNTVARIILKNREYGVAFFRDATDRMQTEARLRELNRTLERRVEEEVAGNREKDQIMFRQARSAMMGEMLSMIAHQWRQPLNAISAAAIDLNLAQELDVLSPEGVMERTGFIEEQAGKMSQTINDFMDFFKPSRHKERFSLEGVCRNVERVVDAQFRSREIAYRCRVEEGLALYGHLNDFEHVLLNLLANARDALEENAGTERAIWLEAWWEEERIVVTVEDTGGGIPDQVMERIFDPYFTTKEQGKGNGIGLYMTKIIVERNLAGSIAAENGEKGARFRLVFSPVE